jgi:murein DD-endopeptidase MepM/ murein hydrolase activator NlpD
MVMRWFLAMLLMLATGATVAASELHLEGQPRQGGLILGQVGPGSTVRLDGRELAVTEDGWFVFGFGRDSGPTAELAVRHPDGREEQRMLQVAARTYEVQRIDGLPPSKVTPRTEEEIARIQADATLIQAAKRRGSPLRGFLEPARWPVPGPISGIYGSQRILNGEPRSPHRGVDVAAPPGTPVGAMASGVVSLAQMDMYFTGNTVMVDHGHGLHSIYAHLSAIDVEVGQTVRAGTPVGAVGATGRVTGPHLHWGVYWYERAIDPQPLVGPMPASG